MAVSRTRLVLPDGVENLVSAATLGEALAALSEGETLTVRRHDGAWMTAQRSGERIALGYRLHPNKARLVSESALDPSRAASILEGFAASRSGWARRTGWDEAEPAKAPPSYTLAHDGIHYPIASEKRAGLWRWLTVPMLGTRLILAGVAMTVLGLWMNEDPNRLNALVRLGSLAMGCGVFYEVLYALRTGIANGRGGPCVREVHPVCFWWTILLFIVLGVVMMALTFLF